ncbi:hypothetical protein JB92DRAFT_2834326 [Gautieria morchelliformis]|nr:hypothetical protein JB92DRAFT_2834326 [Gautieria morchelliformis]
MHEVVLEPVDGGGCPYGSGGKGWLARMSSSGGGAGVVQACFYYSMTLRAFPVEEETASIKPVPSQPTSVSVGGTSAKTTKSSKSADAPKSTPSPRNMMTWHLHGLKYHLVHGMCCFAPRDPGVEGLRRESGSTWKDRGIIDQILNVGKAEHYQTKTTCNTDARLYGYNEQHEHDTDDTIYDGAGFLGELTVPDHTRAPGRMIHTSTRDAEAEARTVVLAPTG